MLSKQDCSERLTLIFRTTWVALHWLQLAPFLIKIPPFQLSNGEIIRWGGPVHQELDQVGGSFRWTGVIPKHAALIKAHHMYWCHKPWHADRSLSSSQVRGCGAFMLQWHIIDQFSENYFGLKSLFQNSATHIMVLMHRVVEERGIFT